MPEHLIRLRGGWLWQPPQAEARSVAGCRVTLPLTWPAGHAGRIRLVRSFGPPPLDPDRETLALRLEQVGGLVSVRLNDREIARPTPGTTALEIPLPSPLPRRNLLVLDVDPPGPERAPEPWGVVALVIGPREPFTPTNRAAPEAASPQVGEESLGGSAPHE
jgi:hypothetical protein